MGSMTILALTALTMAAGAPQDAGPDDRIYGRVTTMSGDVYQGFIRWDTNEGSWTDLLNGSKEMPPENLEEAERLTGEKRERERSVEFLGIRISWEEDDDYPSSAESGVRFGHVRTLTVLDDQTALLELKSGEDVELRGGSTDLGEDIRGIEIQDPDRGTVELEWRDLDEIDFMAAPSSERPGAARLYGTLEDRWGNAYTGHVAWDLDEILTSDVLDGEEDERDREIPFENVAAIERYGSSGARVSLTNGEEMILRGSNDVDHDNRGIQISDAALGQVQVEWDEFEVVRFHRPDRSIRYDDFDGGHRLRGTVVTEDGTEYTGDVRWDNDEEFSWEILDGEFRDVEYDIEFGNIQRIEKRSTRSAEVTLRDGRTFELEGSNDVDRDNKGIFVHLDDGSTVVVDWHDFREIVFERR